jgi:hypothetical protein
VVLSRHLAATKSQLLSNVNVTSRALSLYARTGIPRNGSLLRAPHPDAPASGFPTGVTALKRVGVTQAELRERFWDLERGYGIFAAFDAELLSAFFPPTLWPALTTMIVEGPGPAAERAERAYNGYARKLVPANKRRREGRPARGTVRHLRDMYLSLFRVIVDLRRRNFRCDALEFWTGVPELPMPETEMAPGLDTEGPRPELLREKCAELNLDIRRRLRMGPEDDELSALERMPESCILFRGLFGPLRNRVVLEGIVLTNSRRKAFADLWVRHYVPDQHGPAPDYRVGPALLMRPGKSVLPNVVRAKHIPAEFAAHIDVYLAFLRRAAAARRSDKPHRKRHLGPDRVPEDFPLIVSGQTNFRALGEHGIGSLLSGVLPSRNGAGGRRPLIVRESGMNEDLTAEQRVWVGYNAHSYRHTASQLAERAGELWEKEHPANGSLPRATPALYAYALDDQTPPGDPLRAIYGDKKKESAYELLAGRAIEGIWRLLTTDEGARKRLNSAAYAETWRRRREAERGLASVFERANRISLERDPGGTIEERLAYQTRVTKVLIQSVLCQNQLGEELRKAEAHLKDLRYDEALWERIPDDAPPGSERVDIKELEASLACKFGATASRIT